MRLGTIYTLYNNRRAGAELFFERTISEIASIGKNIKVTIFCNNEASNVLKHEKKYTLKYIRFLDNQYTKPIWLEIFSRRHISKENFDLFWIPSGTNSFPGRWEVPVVTTIHDIGECHIKNKYGLARTFYRTKICLPCSLRRSDRIVTVSNFTASDIKNTFNYAGSLNVVYEAPNPWYKGEVKKSAEIIKQETGKTFTKIILCVGRMDFIGKGIDIIINGYKNIFFRNILDDLPPLVFVGPEGEKSALVSYFINKFKLREKVFYLKRVSNDCLESLYNIAIVNTLASRYEGFGITVLESMQRGIPILCSDLKVIKEIAGDSPIYFKTGDSGDFTQKLIDILKGNIDVSNNIKLGLAVSSRYNWESLAKEYLNIFESALGSR